MRLLATEEPLLDEHYPGGTSNQGYNRRGWAAAERSSGTSESVPTRAPLLGRDEQALFRQQEWLWNCDSRQPGGSILQNYGFERERNNGALSAHCFALPADAIVKICDAAVVYGTESRGAVVLQAPRYAMSILPAEQAFVPLTSQSLARSREARLPADRELLGGLLPSLMAWIGSYERWVLDTYGEAYRRHCLQDIDYAFSKPEETPLLWWTAASRWRELLTR